MQTLSELKKFSEKKNKNFERNHFYIESKCDHMKKHELVWNYSYTTGSTF